MYCLVRELPNTEPMDRVKDTLRRYDILPKNTTRATEEQTTLENLFHKRVIAMKGGPVWSVVVSEFRCFVCVFVCVRVRVYVCVCVCECVCVCVCV